MKLLANGGELCKVLQKFSDLEWSKYQSRMVEIVLKDGRIYREDNSAFPPFTAVRFKDEDAKLADKVKQAVDSYSGRVKWIVSPHQRVSFPNVNWVMRPELVIKTVEDAGQGGEVINPQKYMSENYPNFAPLAYADLLNLARHVETVLRGEPID